MVEWSITVVLKTTVPRGTGGSNPSLSANIAENQQVTNLHPDLHPLLVNLGVILHPLFRVPLPKFKIEVQFSGRGEAKANT